jgi:hypothetical protein
MARRAIRWDLPIGCMRGGRRTGPGNALNPKQVGIATINNSSEGPPELFSGILLKGPPNLSKLKPLCALISRPMNNILLFFLNQKHHKIHENSCAKIQI